LPGSSGAIVLSCAKVLGPAARGISISTSVGSVPPLLDDPSVAGERVVIHHAALAAAATASRAPTVIAATRARGTWQL
jgi:hypothetical protein